MNEQLIQEFLKRLDAIGGTIASGGKYVFEQLVRLERVESIVAMITWSTFGILVTIAGALFARYNHRQSKSPLVPVRDPDWDQSDARGARTACIVLSIVGFIIILTSVGANVAGIVVPEASVIKNIINRCVN